MMIEEAIECLANIDHSQDKSLYNAVAIAIDALEKQMPEEPIVRGLNQRYCPACGHGNQTKKYCGDCGQALKFD